MDKEEDGHFTYQQKYYRKNKYEYCRKTLNEYSFAAIEKMKRAGVEKLEQYMIKYPWETEAERYTRRVLSRKNITRSNGCYDDCCSAAMVAYLYSVYRCAFMGYDHVEFYVKKMINIYIVCAIHVYHSVQMLCRENGFRQIEMDNKIWNGKI